MITIYTDGSSRGNPGPGGFGAVLISGAHRKELSQGFRLTTNNRMEITAVLEALKYLVGVKCTFPIVIHSDSQYVVKSINFWIDGWVKKNFEGKKNADLWRAFLDLKKQLPNIKAVWVRGHNGHVENERCDVLAGEAMYNFKALAIDEVCCAIYGGVEKTNKYCK